MSLNRVWRAIDRKLRSLGNFVCHRPFGKHALQPRLCRRGPTRIALRIVNDDAEQQAPSVEGESTILTPHLMAGYLDAEVDCWNAAAWFATGDVGRLDGETFTFNYRAQERIIIRGGVNISPAGH